jgi:flavin reductase (DIM6/NTAB) family NADH-FMN oxidoreductase RutF
MHSHEVDPQSFRDVMSNFPTGVTVVTASAPADQPDAGPGGIAIGSFFSVSLNPILVGFCVGVTSTSWASMRGVGSFCINILGSDQLELCGQMAGKGDKFAGVDYGVSGITGAPILPEVIAYLDCEHFATHRAGDHEIVVGRVLDAAVERGEGDAMVFFRRQYGGFGRLERS